MHLESDLEGRIEHGNERNGLLTSALADSKEDTLSSAERSCWAASGYLAWKASRKGNVSFRSVNVCRMEAFGPLPLMRANRSSTQRSQSLVRLCSDTSTQRF